MSDIQYVAQIYCSQQFARDAVLECRLFSNCLTAVEKCLRMLLRSFLQPFILYLNSPYGYFRSLHKKYTEL